MARTKSSITPEIQFEAARIINEFNLKNSKILSKCFFTPAFNRDFLYLSRNEFGNISPVARLKYTGDMKKWKFAIFTWSNESYDPDELFFPGSQHLNGTIEGAMKACIEAYPV